jgi:small subunit ribosomal protein S16
MACLILKVPLETKGICLKSQSKDQWVNRGQPGLNLGVVHRTRKNQIRDLQRGWCATSLSAHFGATPAAGALRRIYGSIFMSVKIRMKRVGTKNTPVFRIVVADSRSPRDGKFIEELGTYQPLKRGNNYTLDLDRAKYWLSKGAQPSETVASFIKKANKASVQTAAAA